MVLVNFAIFPPHRAVRFISLKNTATRKVNVRKFCYCDSLCTEIGDCCADYDTWNRDHRAPSTRQKPTTLTCKPTPSSLSDSDKIYGYVMVATSCPSSWSNTKTAHACASTNYLADPLTALPVFDKRTNLTYANIYCAMCHGRTRLLRLWSIRIKNNNCSLQCNNPLDTVWEAIPFQDGATDKCIVTPSEANTEPSTHLKKFCGSYANVILVGKGKHFKNPHCALMEKLNISDKHILCSFYNGYRLPPLLKTTLFTFSKDAKKSTTFREKTQRVKFKCQINEFYDPFKGRCFQVPDIDDYKPRTNFNSTRVNATDQCLGPRFTPTSF
ncbi:hypothetical protein OS493_003609 [Desmophyllum pertusum]|uniref:SMB domain-containing protein n=1 Tax=Desmophyllum pertusum TaxID=174260 RepID=A0A9X0A662_9CNID|nr:hypothetical protein OS493_003609 [Desmophyllum pertusum]